MEDGHFFVLLAWIAHGPEISEEIVYQISIRFLLIISLHEIVGKVFVIDFDITFYITPRKNSG